jgi:predicted dehydrogenase
VEAGKHVLCEKPLALDAAECAEMAAAARDADVKLMEAFMYRFHPRTERVIEWARQGRVGKPEAVRSTFTFRLRSADNIRLDPELGGGSLMDVGCYCVNVSRTMVGEEPIEAQATARWTERGVDESMAGILRFPGGAVAHFDCSLALERAEWYEVAGADGLMRVDAAFLPGTDAVQIDEARGREGIERHDVAGADEYRHMVEHFARCVLDDSEPRWSADEAAANMRAITALYRSAREGGAAVPVPD